MIFWDDIASHRNAQEYASIVGKLSKDEVAAQVQMHCFILAKICHRKYRVLNWAIRAGAIGFLTAVLFIALK